MNINTTLISCLGSIPRSSTALSIPSKIKKYPAALLRLGFFIDDLLEKLKKKDPVLFRALQKKIIQIAELDGATLQHFKNLRGDLKDYKRVHVDSFVLLFKVEEEVIIFAKFCHHDEAY